MRALTVDTRLSFFPSAPRRVGEPGDEAILLANYFCKLKCAYVGYYTGDEIKTMATHGTVKAFHPATDDWSTYMERLKHYFVANTATDAAQKASILLIVSSHSVLCSLVPDSVPDNKLEGVAFDTPVGLLKDHYHPAPSKIIQRYHFNTRIRKPEEFIASYIAALRDIAQHCNYGDKLPEMLRDRLVCVVNHKGIATVQAVEASERESKQLAVLNLDLS